MRESDPLLRRLSQVNPITSDLVEGSGRSPMADELLDEITGERPDPGGRRRVPRGRRWVVPALATISALLVFALVLRVAVDSPATAAELLRRTAAVAERQEVPVGTGPYVYRKTRVLTRQTFVVPTGAWTAFLPSVEESWVAADGSGRQRSTPGDYRFLGPRDRAGWEAAGSPSPPGPSDTTMAPGTLPYVDVASLSTSARALAGELSRSLPSTERPADVALFVKVADVLAESDASPQLRAALYRVVAGLPGIELVGEVRDPLGRPGTGVAMAYSSSGSTIRAVMIFDAETSQLLATEDVLMERAPWVDASPGTRLGFIAYLASARTDSVQAVPG